MAQQVPIGKFQVAVEDVLKKYAGYCRQFDPVEVCLGKDELTGQPCLDIRMEFRTPAIRVPDIRCPHLGEELKRDLTSALERLGPDVFRGWLNQGWWQGSGGWCNCQRILLGESARGLHAGGRKLVLWSHQWKSRPATPVEFMPVMREHGLVTA